MWKIADEHKNNTIGYQNSFLLYPPFSEVQSKTLINKSPGDFFKWLELNISKYSKRSRRFYFPTFVLVSGTVFMKIYLTKIEFNDSELRKSIL